MELDSSNEFHPEILDAAESGNESAQNILKSRYKFGSFSCSDVVQIYRSADGGNVKSQFSMGLISKDETESFDWYLKSAENGYAKAQYCVAQCYFNGSGVDKLTLDAIYWYRKAAEQGLAEAQYELALLFFIGKRVTQDLILAREWNAQALAQGYPKAQELQSQLEQFRDNSRAAIPKNHKSDSQIFIPKLEQPKLNKYEQSIKGINNSVNSFNEMVVGAVKFIGILFFIIVIWALIASLFGSCNVVHPD